MINSYKYFYSSNTANKTQYHKTVVHPEYFLLSGFSHIFLYIFKHILLQEIGLFYSTTVCTVSLPQCVVS